MLTCKTISGSFCPISVCVRGCMHGVVHVDSLFAHNFFHRFVDTLRSRTDECLCMHVCIEIGEPCVLLVCMGHWLRFRLCIHVELSEPCVLLVRIGRLATFPFVANDISLPFLSN